MQRRENTGVGIKRVNQGHKLCQNIVPLKEHRTQILTAWIQNVDRHSHGLSDHDEYGKFPEAVNIIQHEIQQGADDQKIPGHIKDQEELIKWNEIIQPAVNHMMSENTG